MYPYQQQFIRFCLAEKILRFGEFKLKSGRVSPYFFNSGLFNTGSKLAHLGNFYADAILASGIKYDMLFGPAYKGIPLVTATSIALAQKQHDVAYAFNRKEAKDHGEGGNIVGHPLQGDVLIIDDVITAGTAIGEAMAILKQHDAKAKAVIIAMDRQEKGNSELSAIKEVEQKYQIPVISIIKLEHLLDYVVQDENLRNEIKALEAYREQYGVLT